MLEDIKTEELDVLKSIIKQAVISIIPQLVKDITPIITNLVPAIIKEYIYIYYSGS